MGDAVQLPPRGTPAREAIDRASDPAGERHGKLEALFASWPWKLVEKHSPLCVAEIAELRKRIQELGE